MIKQRADNQMGEFRRAAAELFKNTKKALLICEEDVRIDADMVVI